MNICDNYQFLVTRIFGYSAFSSVSKFEYRKLKSYFHLLILLSDDIHLNPEPNHQDKLQCMNELNNFESRGLHLSISASIVFYRKFRNFES